MQCPQRTCSSEGFVLPGHATCEYLRTSISYLQPRDLPNCTIARRTNSAQSKFQTPRNPLTLRPLNKQPEQAYKSLRTFRALRSQAFGLGTLRASKSPAQPQPQPILIPRPFSPGVASHPRSAIGPSPLQASGPVLRLADRYTSLPGSLVFVFVENGFSSFFVQSSFALALSPMHVVAQ
jgi:hypothetical protein